MNSEFISHSEDDTIAFGERYAKNLIPGDIVGLFGNLGTGKTQFVKGVCEYFNVNEIVSSPTFIIVNEYSGKFNNRPININHFDLYRLKHVTELTQIGIDNYVSDNSVCVIEWAELADEYFKGNLKKVYFEYGESDSKRKIKF